MGWVKGPRPLLNRLSPSVIGVYASDAPGSTQWSMYAYDLIRCVCEKLGCEERSIGDSVWVTD